MAGERAKPVPYSKPQTTKSDTLGTVIRSGMAGVAACVLAGAVASPAGLGGLIGVAEGKDRSASDAGADLHLPAVTQQLSQQELTSIDEALTQSLSEMQDMRAKTDAEIEHMRLVAESSRLDIRG